MIPAQRLRDRVYTGELVTGILVTDHLWPGLVEIAQRSGLDYLVVDLEHGPAGPELVAETCATGRRLGFPILIRPRSNDYATIRHTLDLGPCGLLLAGVDSPTDLDTVADAVCLPPRGRRRPGGPGNAWVSDFSLGAWQEQVEAHLMVLPQIETLRGLAQASAIAEHPITTALAVGPYDLSAELGVCGQMQSSALREALEHLKQVAANAKRPMWMIGGDAASLVRDGWRFLCVGEPSAILAGALRERVQLAQQSLASVSPPPLV